MFTRDFGEDCATFFFHYNFNRISIKYVVAIARKKSKKRNNIATLATVGKGQDILETVYLLINAQKGKNCTTVDGHRRVAS